MELDEVQKNWHAFGLKDPLWAILTQKDKDSNRWEPEEFFATGEADVAAILEEARHAGIAIDFDTALDFGCGVGRLSQALAARFCQVHGVDISESMLDSARKYNRYADQCQYSLNTSERLDFADGSFDFILSYLVLQHLEPKFALAYIREFMRVLKPGGSAAFQLPVEAVSAPLEESDSVAHLSTFGRLKLVSRRWTPAVVWNLMRRLKLKLCPRLQNAPIMEMHGTPRADLIAAIESGGGKVIYCRTDQSCGPQWVSIRWYIVRMP